MQSSLKVPFCRVQCDGEEAALVTEVLQSGWLTTAGKTFEFERLFAEKVGARHAIAVNSCTAALHLALDAVGVGPGDMVLVPTLTFTATAEVVRYMGADPVFVDTEEGSGLVQAEVIATALKQHPKIKAVMVVHFAGQAADMDAILAVCRPAGVKVIEDAAHAFPSRLRGRMIGSMGDVSCFSFYANKTITTGEGGMLVTNDDAIAKRSKLMRLHGIDRDVWSRFTASKPSWEYDVVAPGFKYNLPDLASAVGLAQLKRADEFRNKRQVIVQFYLSELNGIEGLDLPCVHCTQEEHSWHFFWIVLNEKAKVDRNALIEALAEAGIGYSVHYKPLHRMTYYRDTYGLKNEDYPNAEKHWRGCVSLPLFPSMTIAEARLVVEKVKEVLT